VRQSPTILTLGPLVERDRVSAQVLSSDSPIERPRQYLAMCRSLDLQQVANTEVEAMAIAERWLMARLSGHEKVQIAFDRRQMALARKLMKKRPWRPQG
jgi:hypothetical protein